MAHSLLLGLSSATTGEAADLAAAVATDEESDANVKAGRELRRFALAVLARDVELPTVRDALESEVGSAGVVEAAGIVAQFESINRVADATGTELDDLMEQTMPSMLAGIDLEAMRQG